INRAGELLDDLWVGLPVDVFRRIECGIANHRFQVCGSWSTVRFQYSVYPAAAPQGKRQKAKRLLSRQLNKKWMSCFIPNFCLLPFALLNRARRQSRIGKGNFNFIADLDA